MTSTSPRSTRRSTPDSTPTKFGIGSTSGKTNRPRKKPLARKHKATICSAEPLTPEVAQWIWVDLFLLLCSGHFDGRTPAEMDNARFLSRALDYFKAVEDGAVVPEAEDWW